MKTARSDVAQVTSERAVFHILQKPEAVFVVGGQGRRCTGCFFILLMINVWDKMIYVVL